ncbi:MAG: hypothetical protein HXY34_09990 [Candidatus Thorarchaeota archaeon]|nr:hypothetical protein [Candidatus Thorarchaeota archaeon]
MTTAETSQKRHLGIFAALVIPLYLTAWYAFRPVEPETSRIVESTGFVLWSLIAMLLFLTVARQFAFLQSKPGTVMTSLCVGMLLWCAAESTWLYFTVIGVEPFPSVADLFWIAGYVPMLIGLGVNARGIPVKFKPLTLVVWLTASTAIVLLTSILEIVPILYGGADVSTLITVIYPAFDSLVISLVLVILFKFKAGQVSRPWAAIAVGFILNAVGDILFTYADWLGLYQGAYEPVDYLLAMGYAAFILGGLLFRRIYATEG